METRISDPRKRLYPVVKVNFIGIATLLSLFPRKKPATSGVRFPMSSLSTFSKGWRKTGGSLADSLKMHAEKKMQCSGPERSSYLRLTRNVIAQQQEKHRA